ncbi:MAG: methyltransferase [Bdellovibrionales bacterium]|nr:methyltransferase [Bdellovibrionales bacterium]
MSYPRYTHRPPEHAFTYKYAQPREYHFCLDSIIFAYFLSLQLPAEAPTADFRALDLCAGCGVVGLELAYYRRWIEHFDFLEVQSVFRDSFAENLRITGHEHQDYRFIESHLNHLHKDFFRARYDLIVANPPYFFPQEGVTPSGEVRQRARFFLDAQPSDLFLAIAAALKPQGRAFVLFRPGDPHGRGNEATLNALVPADCRWKIAADIRGTWALEIQKVT